MSSSLPPLLVVSYEFTHSPFSGNGVLARSLVIGLLKATRSGMGLLAPHVVVAMTSVCILSQ